MNKEVAILIEKIREVTGKNQNDVASLIDYEPTYISQILNNKKKASLKMYKKVKMHLDKIMIDNEKNAVRRDDAKETEDAPLPLKETSINTVDATVRNLQENVSDLRDKMNAMQSLLMKVATGQQYANTREAGQALNIEYVKQKKLDIPDSGGN